MNENKKIKLKLLFGLSIIMEYIIIFSNYPEIYFEIQFNDNLIKILRPNYDKKYYNLLKKYLIDNIASMPNVTLVENGNEFKELLPIDIINIIGSEPKSMKLYDIPKNNTLNISDEKFIVINTKVITGKDTNIKNIWDNFVKNELFSLLNNYNNNKIILIGEREYSNCYEYELHGTFSIYSDIVNAKLSNLIDLTIEDTISLYNEETIIRNLNYLSKSIFNIHIGEGGGLKIFAYTNNMIALTNSPVALLNYINTDKFIEYSFNPTEFLNKVKVKLENYE